MNFAHCPDQYIAQVEIGISITLIFLLVLLIFASIGMYMEWIKMRRVRKGTVECKNCKKLTAGYCGITRTARVEYYCPMCNTSFMEEL